MYLQGIDKAYVHVSIQYLHNVSIQYVHVSIHHLHNVRLPYLQMLYNRYIMLVYNTYMLVYNTYIHNVSIGIQGVYDRPTDLSTDQPTLPHLLYNTYLQGKVILQDIPKKLLPAARLIIINKF